MEVFFVTFQRLVTLFLLLVSGCFIRKRGILDKETTTKLSGMVMRFIVPILVINSLNIEFSKELMIKGVLFFFGMIFIHFAALLIGYLTAKLLKIRADVFGVWLYICMFSNGTFMGFPVIAYVFGQESLFYGSMALVAFNLVSYSLGAELIARCSNQQKQKSSIKTLLFTPSNIAFFIGVILFLLPVSLPAPITDAMDLISSVTTPLSMIVVGSMLTENTIKGLFNDWTAYACFIMRLGILPLFNILLLNLIGFDSYMAGIAVLLTAMPGSAMAPIMAQQYGGDSAWASRVIFLTTVGCIFTVPLINILL